MRLRRLAVLAVALTVAAAPVLARQQSPVTLAPPQKPAKKRSSSTTTKTVEAVLVAYQAESKTVRLQPAEPGMAPVDAVLDADCTFVRDGDDDALLTDFKPGERVVARLSRRSYPEGVTFLRTLWDTESYAEDKERRSGTCVGTVAALAPGSIDVKRAADGEVLSFRVSEKTVVVQNDGPAALGAYPVGAPVAVKPRALPSGGLMASVVGGSEAEVAAAHLDTLSQWRGEVVGSEHSNRPGESCILVIKRDDGFRRRVRILGNPPVKGQRGRLLYPSQVPVGSPVRLHLTKDDWKEGLRAADEVSVPAPKRGAGRAKSATLFRD
jgi:hypothetical protein